MKSNSQKAAFPQPESILHQRDAGLTKREWFTGMALMGAMAMRHNIVDSTPEAVAKDAVRAADAALEYLGNHGFL